MGGAEQSRRRRTPTDKTNLVLHMGNRFNERDTWEDSVFADAASTQSEVEG
jgi:hypothetical protein